MVVADFGGPERLSAAEFDYERTVALSDGVFAIALTLLVLTIALPDLHGAARHHLAEQLKSQLSQLYSYALSFGVLGLLWIRHHSMFRTLRRIDWTISLLNLAYLALVAFLPYPTSLIGRYGDESVSVVVYSVTIVLILVLAVAMRTHSRRAQLLSSDAPAEPLRRNVIVGAVFLASIPIALVVSPSAGIWTWMALLVVRLVLRLRPRGRRSAH